MVTELGNFRQPLFWQLTGRPQSGYPLHIVSPVLSQLFLITLPGKPARIEAETSKVSFMFCPWRLWLA